MKNRGKEHIDSYGLELVAPIFDLDENASFQEVLDVCNTINE
jgi:hypothetical protein